MRLIDELNELHAHYARRIEAAVADDDVASAEGFAQAYEDEAVQLMAEREGLIHPALEATIGPILRGTDPISWLARSVLTHTFETQRHRRGGRDAQRDQEAPERLRASHCPKPGQ